MIEGWFVGGKKDGDRVDDDGRSREKRIELNNHKNNNHSLCCWLTHIRTYAGIRRQQRTDLWRNEVR